MSKFYVVEENGEKSCFTGFEEKEFDTESEAVADVESCLDIDEEIGTVGFYTYFICEVNDEL